MAFLLRTVPRTLPRTSVPASRLFTTSTVYQKSATETVKDAAKTVDRAVADKLVDGIEAGQNVAQKAKAATGMSANEAKGKAEELAGQASGKASELSGQAKGKANELSGQAKGKAEEVKGKM